MPDFDPAEIYGYEIKAAFVRMVNKLYADRDFYITELTAIKNRLGDTSALEKERRILDDGVCQGPDRVPADLRDGD